MKPAPHDTVRPGAAALGPVILFLLGLAIFIHTADRGIFATAAPLLGRDLHLSSTRLGLLFSALFWTYVAAQLAAGTVIERLGAPRTLAAGLALWTFATAASGFCTGFTTLVVCRLLLGLGESVSFPCLATVLAESRPPERLGAANGLIMASLGLGPAFGTYAGALLLSALGWRAGFVVFGLASSLWLLPWWAATRLRPLAPAAPAAIRPQIPYRVMLARKSIWVVSASMFCTNYPYYLVLSWLPTYMVKAHGLPMARMGEIVGLIYVIYAAATALTGALSDRLIARGIRLSAVRKGGMALAGLSVAAFLLVAARGNTAAAIAAMAGIAVAFGLSSANVCTIGQTLSGPHCAGKWMAVQNGLGNLAGIVAPALTGWIIDETGSYAAAFIVAAIIALAGVIGWTALLPRIEGQFTGAPAAA